MLSAALSNCQIIFATHVSGLILKRDFTSRSGGVKRFLDQAETLSREWRDHVENSSRSGMGAIPLPWVRQMPNRFASAQVAGPAPGRFPPVEGSACADFPAWVEGGHAKCSSVAERWRRLFPHSDCW